MHPDKRRKGRAIRKRNRDIVSRWHEFSRNVQLADAAVKQMAAAFLASAHSVGTMRAIEREKEKANDRTV